MRFRVALTRSLRSRGLQLGHFIAIPPAVLAIRPTADPHAWLRGRLAYYRSVDPEAGEKLWRAYGAIPESPAV